MKDQIIKRTDVNHAIRIDIQVKEKEADQIEKIVKDRIREREALKAEINVLQRRFEVMNMQTVQNNTQLDTLNRQAQELRIDLEMRI